MTLETSNQLTLHKERQKQLSKSSEFVDSFLRNLPQKDAYQLNKCPTCGSEDSSKLFKKNGGEYAFCGKCDHIFLLNSLKPEYLIDFYKNYPTSSLDWHKNESEFYSKIYNHGLDLIESYKGSGNILDIGCSSGYFLTIASKRGYKSFGIEPNIQESTYATQNGINIIGSTINEIDKGTRFDVITMWDVLEHIDSPKAYIERLKHLLNPEGIIFIQVPTSEALAAKIMRDKCNMFDGIEHLTLFSRKSLKRCFSRANMKLLSAKSVITDSFAIKNYLNFEKDPYQPSRKESESDYSSLIDFDKLEERFLGYKIQACFSSSTES